MQAASHSLKENNSFWMDPVKPIQRPNTFLNLKQLTYLIYLDMIIQIQTCKD